MINDEDVRLMTNYLSIKKVNLEYLHNLLDKQEKQMIDSLLLCKNIEDVRFYSGYITAIKDIKKSINDDFIISKINSN